MCIALATALTVASTAVSAAGAIMQGRQAEAAAEAQARSYEQQAQADQKAASFEAAQEGRKQQIQLSSARAQIGASGVGFAGSPAAVIAANAGQGQMDLEAIRYGSQLRQNGLKTQASISRFEGKQARQASYLNAASIAVKGIGQMYDPTTGKVQLGANPFR